MGCSKMVFATPQPVDKPIDRLADQEKGRDILSK